ncbi:Peptidyl-prolyl cis-trans isomerase FKBP16-3, chloroplastic [Sesamum angolense]|uniref:Peptidyl-prolyl cis-trans isomerase FKBP16-3, chloroplastic n=1 Tax=Sesamum angolense TaxID=2727404 RepID=A0AAE1W3V0_9LAMI|nr:Peptidyl-prolyl cis-trans isomerase FKBP16-3, chloroplastic [Sesamum angolense]
MLFTESGLQYKDIKVGGGPSPPVRFQSKLVARNYFVNVVSQLLENKATNYTFATYHQDTIYLLTNGNMVSGSDTENENAHTRHLIRLTSPKSPIACGSAFESLGGLDDEDNVTDVAKLDTTYLLTNENAVSGSDTENAEQASMTLVFLVSQLFGENKATNYTFATYHQDTTYLLTNGNVVSGSDTQNGNAHTRHLIRPTSPKSPIAYGSEFESLGVVNQMWGKQGHKLNFCKLPPRHNISSYQRKCGHLIRATPPKSPIACESPLESLGGSDEEDNVTDVAKLDITYLLTNGNVVNGSDTENAYTYLNLILLQQDLQYCKSAVATIRRTEVLKMA